MAERFDREPGTVPAEAMALVRPRFAVEPFDAMSVDELAQLLLM